MRPSRLRCSLPSLSHFSLSKVQTSIQLSLRVAALRLSHPHVVLAHSDRETSRGPGRWLRVHVASAASCICSNQRCVGYKSPRSPLPRIGTFDRCAPPFTLRHLSPIIHSTHPLRGSHLAHPTSACRMERFLSFLLFFFRRRLVRPSFAVRPSLPPADSLGARWRLVWLASLFRLLAVPSPSPARSLALHLHHLAFELSDE